MNLRNSAPAWPSLEKFASAASTAAASAWLLAGCSASGSTVTPSAANSLPQFASAAARPSLSFAAQPIQNAIDHEVSFTPFSSAPVADAGDDLTVGPDGNIWLTVSGNGTIVRMTPKGVSTAFKYTSIGQSLSITPGPDRALWFTDIYANLIGKVTTAGVVTTYPLPSNIVNGCQEDATMPLGIIAGPDGAMWFTVSMGAGGSLSCNPGQPPEIGRITKTGQMTFYSMPATPIGISPVRITAGPDGKLWFTTATNENGSNLGVGSITTSGVITVATALAGAVQSHDDDYLTFGTDHNLYVADTINGTIIRTSGYAAAATFHIPGGLHPYGIVPGPSGTLAFSTDGNMLGLMTPGGKFTLFPVPSSFGNGIGGGMAFHGKSNLWFPFNGSHGSANVVRATITL